MTAGVPGSGIGGFFYLLSALLMPVQESVSICQKKSSRASRRIVLRQIVNAAGVLCGVWLTGWFISKAVRLVSKSMPYQDDPGFYFKPFIGLVYGLLTLLSVFLFVQVFSATLRILRPHARRDPTV